MNTHIKDSSLLKFKFSLLIFIIIVYLFFASGLPWIEADVQLQIARNFLANHTLLTDKPLYGWDMRSIDNRFYDPHGLANVILMIPVASLDKVFNKDTGLLLSFLGALTGVVINALTCLVFFLTLLLFRRPLKVSFYATLCLAFLTIIFPYSTTNYEGNLNMLSMLSALYFLFKFLESNAWRHMVLAGSFSGLAVNTREFSFIFLFCVSIFIFALVLKRKDLKIAALFLLGIFPFFVIFGYYNWIRTGHFYLSPMVVGVLSGKWHKFAPTQNILFGLKGLLLSKGGSIFIYSPILILSIFGWRNFLKDKKPECLLVLSIIASFLLANAKMPEWYGLLCWGPRYTLEITPLMLMPLAWFPVANIYHHTVRYCSAAVIIFSGFIQLSAVMTHWHARIGYLLAKGREAFFFTVRYSQWWDSAKTFLNNLWNLLFGSLWHIENTGYDHTTSSASLYAANTIFTWWNRLIFIGIDPAWIIAYLLLSISALFYLWRYMAAVLASQE